MEPTEGTVFEQDGKAYFVISHTMPPRELAKYIAKGIREMPKIPRARMRILPTEEIRKMPFEKPSKI